MIYDLNISRFKDSLNSKYSVRNYRSVERNTGTCISRELPTVFQVSDSASRETARR
ncbi:MAG: hypothetical protein LBC68_02915 [Prevotellaceae bacterium]|nr:hypothetical protein [Prevotellaceae bacterium]